MSAKRNYIFWWKSTEAFELWDKSFVQIFIQVKKKTIILQTCKLVKFESKTTGNEASFMKKNNKD